jgi:hypothetical protein
MLEVSQTGFGRYLVELLRTALVSTLGLLMARRE